MAPTATNDIYAVGWWQEGHPACKKLPLTVSCFIKIQVGFTVLVSAHLGSPVKRAIKHV